MSDESSSPASAVEGETVAANQNVFRGFSPENFVEWPAWRKLRALLNPNGGCYGIYGPRGSGKSWLMLRAVHDVRRRGGLGLWYPSPSVYDAQAFLSSLSDSFANEIERRDQRESRLAHIFSVARVPLALVILTALAVALVLAATGTTALPSPFEPSSPYDLPLPRAGPGFKPPVLCVAANTPSGCVHTQAQYDRLYQDWENARRDYLDTVLFPRAVNSADNRFTIELALGIAAVLAIAYLAKRWIEATTREARLRREARALREKVRFSVTQREGNQLGAQGGHNISASFQRSRERELVERPATLSGLIHDFRTLAERAAAMAGLVVIAIDELDKMSDGRKVRALLRDIKGVFEIPGVCFLVSVSHEAARSLHLGAFGDRNEFNSSFYTVLELPPLPPEDCAKLVSSRIEADLDHRLGLALGVISGGNVRELLRVADLVLDPDRHNEWQVEPALRTIMRAEALEFRRAVVVSGREDGGVESADDPKPVARVGEQARVGVFETLEETQFASKTRFCQFTGRALDPEVWRPLWADDAWGEQFEEGWRKLLVRLRVAGDIASNEEMLRDPTRTYELQQLVIVASLSADVAKSIIERGTEAPSTLTPDAPATDDPEQKAAAPTPASQSRRTAKPRIRKAKIPSSEPLPEPPAG